MAEMVARPLSRRKGSGPVAVWDGEMMAAVRG
jgi:hypothetical protein